ncbi:hypothetical protein E2C01_030771 [Portunus trituberculatus]|uniref:Uncharacterized protein n=1 Tax=Portunus trituberculatus TaxID=210409 RepID=A0A5B7EVS0_PORTR|nr:hypothetical protein [Portunus trituberculatus]
MNSFSALRLHALSGRRERDEARQERSVRVAWDWHATNPSVGHPAQLLSLPGVGVAGAWEGEGGKRNHSF